MKSRLTILVLLGLFVLFVIVSPLSVAGQEVEKGTEKETTPAQESSLEQDSLLALKNDFEEIVLLIYKAVEVISSGQDGMSYLDDAEAKAEVFSKKYKKEALLGLIRTYKNYTPEMWREQVNIALLTLQGMIQFSQGQLKEALNEWKEAITISKKLKDIASEASNLVNIATVYISFSQYEDALHCYKEAIEINRKIGNIAGEAMALMGIGDVHYSLGKNMEALDFYKKALEINQLIGNTFGEATVLIGSGNTYLNLGKYNIALQNYKQALEINRKIGNTAGEAMSIMGIGNVYSGLKKYSEALDFYKKSLEIGEKTGVSLTKSLIFMNMGRIYLILSQYTEALEYLNQALEIFRKMEDVKNETLSLQGIAVIYYRTGQYAEALNLNQQAIELTGKIGDRKTEADIINNMGNVYFSYGQYVEALACYQKAFEINRRMERKAEEAFAINNIGNVYVKLGQYTEAMNHFKKAFELSKEIENLAVEIAATNNIGEVYSRRGQHTEALTYHKKVLELAQKTKDIYYEALSLHNIGTTLSRTDQFNESMNYLKRALEIFKKIGDLANEAMTYSDIAYIYQRLGQFENAIQVFKESIRISEQLGDLEALWPSYRGIGGTYLALGRVEELITYYKKSIETIEELYTHTSGLKEEERSSMIGEKSFVYQEFIELLLELHRKDPTKGYDKQAFVIAEKAKSRTFQELMAKAGAKIAFAGDETFKKMVEKEQQLIAELTNLRTLLTKEYSKPEKEQNQEVITSLKEQVTKAEQSLNELEKEIEVKYPRYADLKKPKPLTVEELQEILKPDETVISYAVGKDKTAGFVIGKNSFKLVEINIGREEIAKLVKDFRTGLEDVMKLNDLEEFDPEASHKLYQVLFQPFSDELKGGTALYISGDDILYTIPFEALVDKDIDIKAFRQARSKGREGGSPYLGEYATLHYLLDTYTITYLPSASVLRSLRKYEKPGYGKWDKPLIAFADPIFSENEGESQMKGIHGKGINPETQLMAQLLTRSTGSEKLDRLKESAQEAEAIAEEIKGRKEDIYLRDKATEDNVYKINLKDSRYILFSTHGLLGGDFSGVAEPALALTLINNPPKRDGFLTMSEVLGLDLNSELIILSACNTSGKGDKVGSGEGFVGLTRSFMYAGSKSLLVTHWSVESVSARDLMVNTMKLIKDKKARPVALREAKLQMKGSSRADPKTKQRFSLSHPFFWAPFVLVGEGK